MQFILNVLLISSLGLSVISETCLESKQLETNCGSYCFKVVKPLLDHAGSLQRHVNDDGQNVDFQSKLENIKQELANSQSKLGNVERELAILQSKAAMETTQKQLFQLKFENIDHQLSVLQSKIDSLEPLSSKPKTQVQSEMFEKIGSKYYHIVGSYIASWITAVHKCHAMGAHLASIQNENEFDLLKAKLNIERNYWIDVSDLSQEGEFLSHTTGLKAAYLNWYANNPDNWKGNEHCVHLWNYAKFQMNDTPCSSLFHFICEL